MPTDTTAYDNWRDIGHQIYLLHQAGQPIPPDLQDRFQQAQTALAFASYHPSQIAVGGVNFLEDGTVIDMTYGLPTGEVLTSAQMSALQSGQSVAAVGSGAVTAKVTSVSPRTVINDAFKQGGVETATVVVDANSPAASAQTSLPSTPTVDQISKPSTSGPLNTDRQQIIPPTTANDAGVGSVPVSAATLSTTQTSQTTSTSNGNHKVGIVLAILAAILGAVALGRHT